MITVEQIQLPLPYEEIAAVCRRLEVQQLAVFGSVLRGDFTPASDVDFAVEFVNDDAGPWAGKFGELEQELARLLGRRVEVADLKAIQHSRNRILRDSIISSAKIIYAA